MREIKFRSWHIPTKKMFDVFSWCKDCVFEDSEDGVGTSPYLPAETKDCILLQFTGLKDKNGKDIYECDEMSGEDVYGKKIKGVVKFIDGAFSLISSNHFFTQAGHSNHSHTYFRDMASQLEICGLVIADLNVT